MHRFVLLLAALPTLALAEVPTTVSTQGRLSDGVGVPLDGAHDLQFRLWDAPAGGSELWQELHTLDFANGYYEAQLGETNAIDAAVLESGEVWLSLEVDGGAPLPDRMALDSVPYAVIAGGVRGGVVDATEVRINGTTVIDSTGAVSGTVQFDDLDGLPADIADGDADTLASLSCSDGQLAVLSGGVWACGDPVSWSTLSGVPSDLADGEVAWGEVTAKPGFLADGQVTWGEVQSIPADLADGEVAWGEVTGKPALPTVSGSAGYLAQFTAPDTVGDSPLFVDAAGEVGIGTATPTADFMVDGTAHFNTNTATTPFSYGRHAGTGNQLVEHTVGDTNATVHYINDEASSSMTFRLENTDTETGGGAAANSNAMLHMVGNAGGGGVGIGTTSLDPNARLTVDGMVFGQASVAIFDRPTGSGSNYDILWPTVTRNPGGFVTQASNDAEFTLTQAGWYRVNVALLVNSIDATTVYRLYATKNGSTWRHLDRWGNQETPTSSDPYHYVNNSFYINSDGNDVLKLDIRVDSGDTSNIYTSCAGCYNQLAIEFLGIN